MRNLMLCIPTIGSLALASGAAHADEKSYEFAGFEGVSVSAGITAEITVGGEYAVRAEGAAAGLDRLDIKVRGGALDIGRKGMGLGWGRTSKVTVYISTPTLSALDASSGSNARASGVASDAFAIDASSGATASVSGECGALNVDASSGANIDAGELRCKSANLDASSGANATIFASESLVADVSTGANITVLGEPKNVDSDRSTGGNIRVVK